MIGDPLKRPPHFCDHPSVTEPGHRDVARIRPRVDAPPAPVLPPQDCGHKSLPAQQPISVSDQPHTSGRIPDVGHRRAETEVLPADMGHVVDPRTRRSKVPVKEGHRPKLATEQPIDRVLGREVVMTHDLLVPGQWSPGRQVMELTHEPGNRHQTFVRRHSSRLPRLPRHMPGEVTEDLTTLLVHTEKPRSPVPSTGFEQPQQITHERGSSRGGTAHRVSDTNDGIDETSGQERLRHPPTLPDRYAVNPHAWLYGRRRPALSPPPPRGVADGGRAVRHRPRPA